MNGDFFLIYTIETIIMTRLLAIFTLFSVVHKRDIKQFKFQKEHCAHSDDR